MPGGKPAGVRCLQLTVENKCALFGKDEMFLVKLNFIAYLTALLVLAGLWMARSKWAHWALDPLVSFGFPAPKIAFVPIFASRVVRAGNGSVT